MNREALVRPSLKDACFANGLSGLVFQQAVDLTHADRGVERRIP